MPVYIRDADTWKQFPTTPAGTRAIRVRDVATWKTPIRVHVKWNDIWQTEGQYTFKPAAPTNFRATSGSTDYTGIDLAWDYAGIVTPKRWVLGIYDYGSNSASTPTYSETFLSDPAQRTYRLNLASNTYVSLVLAAESTTGDRTFFGGSTTTPVASAGLKRHVGAASYTVYDVPVYGWADTWEWTPPFVFESSRYADANSGDKAVDNNMPSAWISSAHAQTGTVNDWEAVWVRMPYWAHHKYVGLRVIQEEAGSSLPSCYLTHGVYYSNAWQGSVNQPISSPPCHPWLVHPNISYYSVSNDQYVYEGDFVTDGGSNPSGNLVSVMLGPNLKTSAFVFGYYCAIHEIRLLLQNYRVVSYGPRTVAAVPSGTW